MESQLNNRYENEMTELKKTFLEREGNLKDTYDAKIQKLREEFRQKNDNQESLIEQLKEKSRTLESREITLDSSNNEAQTKLRLLLKEAEKLREENKQLLEENKKVNKTNHRNDIEISSLKVSWVIDNRAAKRQSFCKQQNLFSTLDKT